MTTTRLQRPIAQLLTVILFAALIAIAGAETAQAASIEVTTTADNLIDDSDCTLREAIRTANTDDNTAETACTDGSGADVITFEDEDAIYKLQLTAADEDSNATGDYDITSPITISGNDDDEDPDDETTIIDGAATGNIDCGVNGTDETDRLFHVQTGGVLTLNDLTVRNGRVEDSNNSIDEEGGGIWNEAGSVTLNNVSVRGNSVCDSDGDDAKGGGVASDANTLTLNQTNISENDAITAGAGLALGGGIYHSGTTLNIDDSTIDANVATGDTNPSQGGGIWADQVGDLQNSTISGNVSFGSGVGGGIYYDTSNDVDFDLEHVTITDNDDGGIVAAGAGTGEVNLDFSLIGDQDTGADCDETGSGIINADNNNLDSDGSCDDAEEGSPDLDGLDDNGGATETHLPDDSSDAIDLIDNNDCSGPNDDQRGENRPEDSNGDCDAGSVERQDNEDSGGSSGGSSSAGDELDVTPETATNTLPGDTTHALTAKFDEGEIGSGDEDNIDWKIISGPNVRGQDDEPDFECSLASDQCTFTYTGNGQAGTDVICAWNDFDDDDNFSEAGASADGGRCDTETLTPSSSVDDDFTDVVQKTWQMASPTPTPTPTPRPSPTDGGQTKVLVESLVTIDYKRRHHAFRGEVLAARNRCVAGRIVKLKHNGTTVGRDRTSASGKYSIGERHPNGSYKAVATRKVFTAGNGDRVVCTRDASREIDV